MFAPVDGLNDPDAAADGAAQAACPLRQLR